MFKKILLKTCLPFAIRNSDICNGLNKTKKKNITPHKQNDALLISLLSSPLFTLLHFVPRSSCQLAFVLFWPIGSTIGGKLEGKMRGEARVFPSRLCCWHLWWWLHPAHGSTFLLQFPLHGPRSHCGYSSHQAAQTSKICKTTFFPSIQLRARRRVVVLGQRMVVGHGSTFLILFISGLPHMSLFGI